MPEQNYKNHVRLDPAFHLTLVPLLWFILGATVLLWWRHHTFARGVGICVGIALFWIAFLARTYSLKLQTRIIRLEESLRLKSLGVDASLLSTRQLVGLRFASDNEAPLLAERAVREQMASKQIKQAVQHWRADNDRV